jgi:hypothetical protein
LAAGSLGDVVKPSSNDWLAISNARRPKHHEHILKNLPAAKEALRELTQEAGISPKHRTWREPTVSDSAGKVEKILASYDAFTLVLQ